MDWNTIANNFSNILGNMKSSYQAHPEVYKAVGGTLGSSLLGALGGMENRANRANLIKASYYKNPYLMSSLQKPTDYSDYYADFLNNMYLNSIANGQHDKSWNNKLIDMNASLNNLRGDIRQKYGVEPSQNIQDYDTFSDWSRAQRDSLENYGSNSTGWKRKTPSEFFGNIADKAGTLADYNIY